MKISIVLCTYNGEKYITEQLESLRKQIKQADEILIFDDRSNDKTIQIIQNYIQHYKLEKWKLFINERNKGWKQNFMDGMQQASGDLIFPCDQDDIWLDDKLSEIEKIMKEHQDIQILATNYYEFYDNCNKRNVGYKYKNEVLVKPGYELRLFNVQYPGCTFCVRKMYFEKIMKYWEKEYPHDAFLWRCALMDEKMYVYNKPLIYWRKHSDSTFSIEAKAGKNRKQKLEWIKYAENVLGNLENFILHEIVNEKEKKLNTVSKYKRWCLRREKFYLSHNPIYGVILLKDMGCYSHKKQYIGDWVITYCWH